MALTKARDKEDQKLQKQLFHLQADRFNPKQSAQAALEKLLKKLGYHKLETVTFTPPYQIRQSGSTDPRKFH